MIIGPYVGLFGLLNSAICVRMYYRAIERHAPGGTSKIEISPQFQKSIVTVT